MITIQSCTHIFCDGTVRFNTANLKNSGDGLLTISQGEKVEPGTCESREDYKGEDDVVRIIFSDIRSVEALIACASVIKQGMESRKETKP